MNEALVQFGVKGKNQRRFYKPSLILLSSANTLSDEMLKTSEVEVTQISKHGIWLLLVDKEHFLSFDNFPWFKDAAVPAIRNVSLLNGNHLYWPDLDVDLATESITKPGNFPLVAK